MRKQTLLMTAALLVVAPLSLFAESITLSFKTESTQVPFPSGDYPDWTVGSSSATPKVFIDAFGVGIERMRGLDDTAQGNAALYWMGTQGSVVNGQLTQYKVSVDTQFIASGATTTSGGVAVGAQAPLYNKFGGYYIGYVPVGGNAGVGIWGDTGHAHSELDALAYTSFASGDLTQGETYQLQVSVTDNAITGTLFSSNDVELGSVTLLNPSDLSPGLFGLRSANGNTNVATVYNNIEITIIPEPSIGGVLLGVGGILMVVLLRRAKKR